MRRAWRLLVLLVAILPTVAVPASALKWEVTSTNTSRVAPNPFPGGRAIGNAFHQVQITQWDLVDAMVPFTFEVSKGKLFHEQGLMQTCRSGKIWFDGGRNSSAYCNTFTEIEPCYPGEGTWHSEAVGILQGYPFESGTKVGVGIPLVLVCPC